MSIFYKAGELLSRIKKNTAFSSLVDAIVEVEEKIGDFCNSNNVSRGVVTNAKYISTAANALGSMSAIQPLLSSVETVPNEPLLGFITKDFKYNVLPNPSQAVLCGMGCAFDTCDRTICAMEYLAGSEFLQEMHPTGLCTNSNCPHFSGLIDQPSGEGDAISKKPFLTDRVTDCEVEDGALSTGFSVNFRSTHSGVGTTYGVLNGTGYSGLATSDFYLPLIIDVVLVGDMTETCVLKAATKKGAIHIHIPICTTGTTTFFVADDGSTYTSVYDIPSFSYVPVNLARAAEQEYRFKTGRRLYRVVPPEVDLNITVPSIVAKEDFSVNRSQRYVLHGAQTLQTLGAFPFSDVGAVSDTSYVQLGFSDLNPAANYALIINPRSDQLDVPVQTVSISNSSGLLTADIGVSKKASPNSPYLYFDLTEHAAIYADGTLKVTLAAEDIRAALSSIFIVDISESEHPNNEKSQIFSSLVDTTTSLEVQTDLIYIYNTATRWLVQSVPDIVFNVGWFDESTDWNCFDMSYYGPELVPFPTERYVIFFCQTPLSDVISACIRGYLEHVDDSLKHFTQKDICNMVKQKSECCSPMYTCTLGINTYHGMVKTTLFRFVVATSDPTTNVKTYTLYFGDGQTHTVTSRENNVIITHKYNKIGNFLAKAEITTTEKGICTQTKVSGVITVAAQPIITGFSKILESYTASTATYIFTISCSPDNNAEKIFYFGDGSKTQTRNSIIEHTFLKGGRYYVTVEVQGANRDSVVYDLALIELAQQ